MSLYGLSKACVRGVSGIPVWGVLIEQPKMITGRTREFLLVKEKKMQGKEDRYKTQHNMHPRRAPVIDPGLGIDPTTDSALLFSYVWGWFWFCALALLCFKSSWSSYSLPHVAQSG